MACKKHLTRVSSLILMGALTACAGTAATAITTTTTIVTKTVTVRLVDFAFVGLPASVAAGTKFTLVNEAETELHEMVAFRLAEDESRSVADLTGLNPEELERALGRPVFVLLAPPGGPVIPAVGDGTLAEPGRYAIFCFIPTGVDPQVYLEAAAAAQGGPPQVEGGPPHFVHGMYGEVTVP
jgi:hypothetical protein